MKSWSKLFGISTLGILIFTGSANLIAQSEKADTPETVMATFRVKPGQLNALLRLMPAYREALRKNHLIEDTPYLLMTGIEDGKPIVVAIFSWRNHDVPENVPSEIQEYWNQFNSMVEDRGGRKGIEFPEMNLVPVQSR